MEGKFWRSRMRIVCVLMVIIIGDMALSCLACSSDGGSECKNCIVNQMKTGCPKCVPIMQCMAQCLWGGKSRSKCTKKCDCNTGGYPRLSDCKKCLAQCKCSCSASD